MSAVQPQLATTTRPLFSVAGSHCETPSQLMPPFSLFSVAGSLCESPPQVLPPSQPLRVPPSAAAPVAASASPPQLPR